MTLVEFFTELKSRNPELTVDDLGRIRQHGPAPGQMSCPLQIVYGHREYMNVAQDEGLTYIEVISIINASDFPDHAGKVVQIIRKKLLELVRK